MYDLRKIKTFKIKKVEVGWVRREELYICGIKGTEFKRGKQKNKNLGDSEKQPYFLSTISVQSG